MSTDINVFIEAEKMLSPNDWQLELENAGFPLTLYKDFDPKDFSGMLPCDLAGEEVGFEFYFDALEDTMFDPSQDEDLAERLGPRQTCVGFSVSAGASEQSIHAAAFAAATLARAANGLLWIDPEFIETDDPVEWIKRGE
jgi:hypothetical protein